MSGPDWAQIVAVESHDPSSSPQWEQLRGVIERALDRHDALVTVRQVDEALDDVMAAIEPYVMSNVSMGVAGEPLVRQTWRQMYDREQAERRKLSEYATIVADLDRCEHGRHEGDDCSSCDGPSKGNPLWEWDDDERELRIVRRFGTSHPPVGIILNATEYPERLIGFGLDASPICVPERPQPGSTPLTAESYYRRDLR